MATKTDPPEQDQPRPARAPLPTFTQPTPPPATDPPPPLTLHQLEQLGADNLFSPTLAPRSLLQDDGDRPTRTGTSSPGSKPKHADVALLVVGCLGLVVLAAAGLVRWRLRAQLRRPTDDHLEDVAGPVARILMRHVDLSKLPADLGDVIAAGTAVGHYVNDGPLIEAYYEDPGMPDDLQGEVAA